MVIFTAINFIINDTGVFCLLNSQNIAKRELIGQIKYSISI